MVSPSTNVRRHFLPWNRPLLAQAVAWLADGWDGGGPLDLGATLVVVPTRQSGRRLREALAGFAATRDQAVFPPRVHTPDTLLADGAAASDVASRLDAVLAWSEVLLAAYFAELPDLFPVAPPRQDFAWAWRLAENFFRLQTQLTEAGLGFGDVAATVSADFPETERWRQLADLEQRQVDLLVAQGRREPHAARRDFARHPSLPPGVSRVIVLAVPDPLPLALDVLGAWAARVPVVVGVFADANEAEAFDCWGRPLAERWKGRALALPEFERRVHLCADPNDQAERIAVAARRYGDRAEGSIAVGVADAEILPRLANELSRTGLASFNPEGRPRRHEALFTLLTALAGLAREPSFEAVAALARCPDFLAALVAKGGEGISAARWLSELDRLRERHLPADLNAARAFAGASPELNLGFEFIAALHDLLAGSSFPQSAVAALGAIFEHRRFDLARPEDARIVAAAEVWRDTMRECAAAKAHGGALRANDWWDVVLRMFGDSRSAEDKPSGALELQGWLELLWEDAPHLVVAGLNDGLVPEAVVGDAFLPETLRVRLGLKTNAARFARDAYLLQALANCRPRLDVLSGKNSAAGEPLRPSRLLLQCADADLPARVDFLFRELEPVRHVVPWTRAWRVAPPKVDVPARVSVTALRAWLDCPFRFYLRHVLKMESVDPAKDELDALDFGTLVHGALEALGLEKALREVTDATVLREFLERELERQARRRFGADLTLPLSMQFDAARQRLAKAAEVEAGERAAGWRVVDVERKFTVQIGGIVVSGKIDRIDRHATTGVVRVLDYKTSDQPAAPADAHLRGLRRDEQRPDWSVVNIGDKLRVWSDLQLPLYEHALAAEFGGGVTCGYFNLPKAVGETGIVLWEDLTPELRAAARRCAEGVCAAIRAGEFWPPRELTGREAERDDFAALFHHGAAASVAWDSARAGEAVERR